MAPRVVLDTNTVLSALIFPRGRLVPLREAWQQARCLPLVSNPTLAELVRVLTYPKFRLDAGQQRELLADYLPYACAVPLPAKPPRTPRCRDPGDVPFLQLAIAGEADYLVSGDRDLLSVEWHAACKIVAPERFMEVLRGGCGG